MRDTGHFYLCTVGFDLYFVCMLVGKLLATPSTVDTLNGLLGFSLSKVHLVMRANLAHFLFCQ